MSKSRSGHSTQACPKPVVEGDQLLIEALRLRSALSARVFRLLIQFRECCCLLLSNPVTSHNQLSMRRLDRGERGLVRVEALHDLEFDLLKCVLAPAQGLQLTHQSLGIFGPDRSRIQSLLVTISTRTHLLDVGLSLGQFSAQITDRST